ncbi:MAG: hypothetical protein HZB31_14330 [Nitrospirae bacterium]|nr:hypothetical protein [Nitrospirota bacterium]
MLKCSRPFITTAIHMKKENTRHPVQDTFTGDNIENIRKAIAQGKNILICGVEGVGKITNTVQAVKNATNVYYLGNPLDYEGKMRPGSYEKYLKYIHSLKKDIRIIEDIEGFFTITQPIILIIDEVYGRSDAEFSHISRLLEMTNIQVIQITGCIKNMKRLIDKIDFILELHVEGAFSVEKDLAQAICRILGKDKPTSKLF